MNGVSQVAVAAIGRNPRQPRARLEPTELEELANSIREHGVIQPLIVAQTAYPGQYTLIAGERRLEASRLAGLATVPVIVREATEQQLLEVALVENIQRSDLGPLETALAYKHLADDFGLSHEAIAAKVGKKRVTVTNTMRLLRCRSGCWKRSRRGDQRGPRPPCCRCPPPKRNWRPMARWCART